MRQKFFIFLALVFLVVLLVGLNAASYVQKEKLPDDEFNPNRSTYNTGATGTRALYELLAETGRKPARWQEPPSALLSGLNGKNNPSTFVVVGALRREFDGEEIEQLLQWVSAGGRLVVIDREPPSDLIATTANWKISAAVEPNRAPTDADSPDDSSIDPSNQRQMTGKTVAAKPVQPTAFTANVNAVQPSRLASGISFERFSDEYASPNDSNNKGISTAPPPAAAPANQADEMTTVRKNENDSSESNLSNGDEALDAHEGSGLAEAPAAQNAPVVHLANDEKNLLVDFPFGAGQIVFLSDPYIVSNGGISLVDNAQIAVNILSPSGAGVVAFDEYHQGFGANGNRLSEYFAGTPVAAILFQATILTALIFLAQSLRFARPLPEAEPNRLSKLEYVSAMAQLQRRAGAFDLAIENIYTDFRRRAARFLVAGNHAVTSEELAKLIAERIDASPVEIENLMRQCEEIVRGERTNRKEVLQIATRLREIEAKLGLKRGKR